MLTDMLQTLSSEKQTQRASPTDLMGATRDRVTVLRRVMENNGSAHLNTIRSLEERMKSTRVTMLVSDICDELTRALRPMTECGQLATAGPRTFCADDYRGYPPLPWYNQLHPILQRRGRTCGAAGGVTTLEESPQNWDGGPWMVGGDEKVGEASGGYTEHPTGRNHNGLWQCCCFIHNIRGRS